jgi:Pectate lyase superfamily protein
MYTVLRFMLLCYVHMQGELWSARGRLSYDWGYAGYRHSTAPPPSHPATSDLREDFGAAGDGVTDDTDALLHALDVLHSGSVLFMPAGRYLLTAVINIRKNVTLRGAGRGSTVLYFPHSLSEIYGSAWLEGGVSAYSHGTGFINVGGWDPTGRNFTLVARVTQVGWRIC